MTGSPWTPREVPDGGPTEVLVSFTRIAIVNRGEAAMRLIHAVREINASGSGPIQTVALHTEGESHATFVREADLSYDLGPGLGAPLHRPGGARAGPGGDRRGRGVAGLGLRGRGPAVRRPVRPARGHLHRPERRGDAPARRQDRLQADRRGGGRARGPVEPRGGRLPRGRAGRRRGDRLPADAQGDGRRRWPGDPDGRLGRPTSRTPTSAPATRRCVRSATAPSSSSAW